MHIGAKPMITAGWKNRMTCHPEEVGLTPWFPDQQVSSTWELMGTAEAQAPSQIY